MKFKMTPNKLMIALFAVVLLVVPIVTAALPKQERSENENRFLEPMPTLVDKNKWNKAESAEDYLKAVKWKYINNREGRAFKDDFETYFCDHLAGRELWVKSANTLTRLSGQREINGVYTLENQLVQTFKGYDETAVNASIKAMNAFAERFPDIPMYIMLAPTSQELFAARMPSYAGLMSEKAFIDGVYSQMVNIGAIDCLSYISGHSDEYVYYRTDHHWTSLGAFYAYQAAAKSLDYSAYGLNAFNIETASRDFRGTLYSKVLDDRIQPDVMEYYHLANGEPTVKMTCRDDREVNVYDSLYVRDFLDVKDKYSSFTGSNVPIVTIETNVDNGKSLLMIKDSYAHSLVPFLSKHYGRITMVDMRYINTGLNGLVNMDEFTEVMFMYNVIGFSEDKNIAKLALTR
ncbi:MAG: DHHW family protein [Lachnospiraceae bacterium]|nr:DHHW family protein [Ruminococcus sp.]MCM1274246.1 DHHW family protein [Lachnospiraceae bacterium]